MKGSQVFKEYMWIFLGGAFVAMIFAILVHPSPHVFSQAGLIATFTSPLWIGAFVILGSSFLNKNLGNEKFYAIGTELKMIKIKGKTTILRIGNSGRENWTPEEWEIYRACGGQS